MLLKKIQYLKVDLNKVNLLFSINIENICDIRMILKQNILNAINEGIRKSLLSFDDSISFEQSSSDSINNRVSNDIRMYDCSQCKLSDHLYMDEDGKYYIWSRKKMVSDVWRQTHPNAQMIGICCGTADQFDDGLPRFRYSILPEHIQGPMCRNQQFIEGCTTNDYNECTDINGYENSKLIKDCYFSGAMDSIMQVTRNPDAYIPSIMELYIAFKNGVMDNGHYWSSTQASKTSMWRLDGYKFNKSQGDIRFAIQSTAKTSKSYKFIPFIHVTPENMGGYYGN